MYRPILLVVTVMTVGCGAPEMDVVCPEGSVLQGSGPPLGRRAACVSLTRKDVSGRPMRHGPELRWFPNGQLRSRQSFKDDELSGRSETWFPNGSRSFLGHYKASLRDGEWREWGRDDVLRSKTSYREGQINGQRWFYYPNGEVKSSHVYIMGVLQGPVTGYFSDGSISYRGQYGSNVPQGAWVRYDQAGNVLAREHFVDGVSTKNAN